ncbi:MAG TPA: DEAD/DEAH box helicase [Pseudonocardiaceae bacterium]|nr:DEAD/DEAH box helicase [Pseudonocardiaceae bacterium]
MLHASVSATGEFVLWAEDADLPARLARGLRGPARGTAAAAHPFAATGKTLLDLLPAVDGAEEPDTLTVLLPSYGSGPLASPELVRDPLAESQPQRGAISIRPWRVPALLLTPAATLRVLAAGTELPDCRLGAAAHYLVRLAAFAGDLAAAGKVLPDLVFDATTLARPTARWRPVLSGMDTVRLDALRQAMPPAFRALPSAPGELTGLAPIVLQRLGLGGLVDAQVRERLAVKDLSLLPPGEQGLVPPGEQGNATVAAWLRALTGEPEFDAEPAALRRLAEQIAAWADSGTEHGPVRTGFRLLAPDQVAGGHHDADQDWRLQFLLQAVDEPSMLVSAKQVWRSSDHVLRRWVDAPQEVLLTGLGKASRLFPRLETALRGAAPTELTLDVEGAYEFLTSAADLDAAGFGVLLPSAWRRPGELSLKLNVTSAGTSGVVARNDGAGMKMLVDYRWDLALGETQLTKDELNALAAAKVPLVNIRGQWVRVDQRRLAAGLAFLRTGGSGQMSADEVLQQAGAYAETEQVPMPVTGVSGTGWLADLLNGGVEQDLEPVTPPAGFGTELRPYQRRGLAWLAFLDRLGLGGCLADDMGLGKTVQLLALEALRRADGKRPPTLLVCPMSLVGNWQREAARFAPMLSVYVHHGANRLAGEDLLDRATEHDLVLTTYAVLARDRAELGSVTWDRVVLDEAQNVKNSASRQAKATRGLPARHRIALTGTPVENRLAELWSIMDFVNPGMLGTEGTFRARFAVPVERYGDTEAAGRLRRITAPFILRRLKTDPKIIDDLPDKIEMKQLCNLTAEQASLYQAVVDDMLGKIENSEGIERKGLVLATMSKLKQVCNHPAQFLRDGTRIAGRSGKLARLEEIIEAALADGDKILCFTQFAEFGSMLVPHLSARFDTEVLFLHGGSTKKARDGMVARFQSATGPSIFLLSLKAGGTGLTLTAANHVVHLDRWWNPAVEDQATDRAFRIGQRRNVQVRKFVCIGTLEEKIDTMIEEKKALARMVVGAGESWLTELSTGELRELVRLSEDAVGD